MHSSHQLSTILQHSFSRTLGRIRTILLLLLQVAGVVYAAEDSTRVLRRLSTDDIVEVRRDSAYFVFRNTGSMFEQGDPFAYFYSFSGYGLFIAGKNHATSAIHSSFGGPYTDINNQPGTINGTYAGDVSVASNPQDARFRIYLIHASDTASTSNPDYSAWPSDQGAPMRSNGTPRLFGDHQFFYVYNDLRTSSRPVLSIPMGIEVRVTGWWNDTDPDGTLIFHFRHEIINRSVYTYDSVHVGLWSDVDLGDEYYDDFAGCDTSLSMLYHYKATEGNSSVFGDFPAAIGVQFLDVQPAVPAGPPLLSTFKPLWRNDSKTSYADIYPGMSNFIQNSYNDLRGRDHSGMLQRDPTTGTRTTYYCPGDPVSGLGWTAEGSGFRPGDLRFIASHGPRTLRSGDTLTFTHSLIGTHTEDRYASIARLRHIASYVRRHYNDSQTAYREIQPSFAMEYPAGASPRARLTLRVKDALSVRAELFTSNGLPLLQADLLKQTSQVNSVGTLDLFDTVVDLPVTTQPPWGDIVVRFVGGTEERYRGAYSRLSTAPSPFLKNVQITYDEINGDRRANPGENIELTARFVNTTPWTIDSLTMDLRRKWQGTYSNSRQNLVHIVSGADTAIPNTIQVRISPSAVSETLLPYEIIDHANRNRWRDTIRIPVSPLDFTPRTILPRHPVGRASYRPEVRIVDPTAIRDHEYAITFTSTRLMIVTDRTTGDTLINKLRFSTGYNDGEVERVFVDGFKILAGKLNQNVSARELRGPGGIPVGSDDDDVRLMRGLDVYDAAGSTGDWRILGYPSDGAFEIRFTRAGSNGYIGRDQGGGSVFTRMQGKFPFEIWCVNDAATPSDDVRLAIFGEDIYQDGFIDWGRGEAVDAFTTVPYQEDGPAQLATPLNYVPHLRLEIRPITNVAFRLPQEGTVIWIGPRIDISTEDVFVFRPVEALEPPAPTILAPPNYPNPFNSSTAILYTLPRMSRVSAIVYDIRGVKVRELLDETREAGNHFIFWNGANSSNIPAASGVYFCRISSDVGTVVRKMVLIR